QKLFVQGGYQGQLSARGETLHLFDANGLERHSVTSPAAPSLAQQYLRVTELMYHPAPAPGTVTSPEEFEYVGLRNISTEHTLDLAGVHFAGGLEVRVGG